MKPALKQATRIWGVHIALAVLSMFFVAGIEQPILQLVLGIALLIGMQASIFNDGAYLGEKAATLAATLERQQANSLSGHVVDEKQAAQVWKKETGLKVLVIALIPFLVLSFANIIAAPYFPEPVVVEEEEPVNEDIFVYEEIDTSAPARINWVQIVTRAVFMPYVFLFNLVSVHTLNWLFVAFSFVSPLSGCVGYLLGPRLRQKKLVAIAKGKRRKMRNLKVNKPPRGPKPEV